MDHNYRGESVRHYPKNIGDWMAATAHLSEVEECIYARMTDQYYAREGPLPLEVSAVCRLVRATSSAARKAVPVLLEEYYDKREDGWHQKRCDLEIAAYQERSASASLSAQVRWTKKAESAMRTHSKTDANAPENDANAMRRQCADIRLRDANHEPVTKNQEPKNFNPIVGLTPDPDEKQLAGKERRDSAKRVLECLNRNAGRKYEAVDANITPILARMREGYTERDLCAIAAVKARQWKGDEKMEQFIRPKTLFTATNAANYRAELPSNRLETE